MSDLFTRFKDNPILSPDQWPYKINSVFNPGVVKLDSGKTLLLCRCEDHSGMSHFCNAISSDGISKWKIDSEPCLLPEGDDEVGGIEDPRITWLEEEKAYAVCYTSCSKFGPGVSIALTKDFYKWDRLGQVFFAENKDAFLFPSRIDDQWVMVHRPVIASGNASMWISYSPDLIHWGGHKQLLEGRGDRYWDGGKIGCACPVIKTVKGWLMIYHSSRDTPGGCLYRCGAALLDLDDPSKCIARSGQWFFGPEADYEMLGDVGNVVFPCGYALDGNKLFLYYGAGDRCIGLATGKLSYLSLWVLGNKI